ncbi:hypothetical protein [Nocardia sp. NPDC004711]
MPNIHAAKTNQWVDDWCDRWRIDELDQKRAEGIMKIHATCTPPCPRVLAARRYLERYGHI